MCTININTLEMVRQVFLASKLFTLMEDKSSSAILKK